MNYLLRIPFYALMLYSIYFIFSYAGTQATLQNRLALVNQQLASAIISTSTDVVETEHSPTIYFFGDMMFDRAVRKQVQNKGIEYVFGDATTTFAAHDITVGNLEGPITSSKSKTLNPDGTTGTDLIFTFPTSTAASIKQLGVDVVSLANNHTQNFGQAGLRETRKLLNEQGVQYFGDPENAGEVSTTTCIETTSTSKKTCIGFVGYHEFAFKNEEVVAKAISDLRANVDFIIVMPHWGNEYKQNFTPHQQSLAHQWINLGADAVIGAHPHVITPLEIYKNKPIFYSLGNFIFDQYFSFETTHGLTLSISLNASSTSYVLKPIQNTGIHLQTPDASTTQTILNSFAEMSKKSVGTSTREEIKNGVVVLSK